ncbi:MAG: hypothetical protein JWM55_1024 [Acidimicrobiaceae bacterium]|nr:hypothetical protein [Acidimicrobiaceae bacterium]
METVIGPDVVTMGAGCPLGTFDRRALDTVVKSRLKPVLRGRTFVGPLVLDSRCTHWRHVLFTPRENLVSERRGSTRGCTHFEQGCYR